MNKKKFKLKNVVVLIMIFYGCYIFVSQQIKIQKIRQEMTIKQSELKELQEKNKKLQDEVKMSKSDIYIEKLARERLGLIKPGETPVINKK